MKKSASQEPVTKSYVDIRFEQVDKRFEQVDKRFEQVDKRFDSLEGKIDKVINELVHISGIVESLQQENTIGAYQTRNLETTMEDHEKRIAHLEQTVVTPR